MSNNRWRSFKKINHDKYLKLAYQRYLNHEMQCPCCLKTHLINEWHDFYNGILHEEVLGCDYCGYWYEYAFGATRWGIRNYFSISYSYNHTSKFYDKKDKQKEVLFKKHRKRLKMERTKVYKKQ